MSAHTHPARDLDPKGSGWIVFAGAMLLLLGSVNTIHGIAAISNSHFFVGDAHFLFGDLKTWGWIVMFLGIGQLLAAFGVFANSRGAAWLGVMVPQLPWELPQPGVPCSSTRTVAPAFSR